MARYKTEAEAVRGWVAELNAIPQALIEKAYRGEERFEQVEFLAGGERVCEHCESSDLRPLTEAEKEEHGDDDEELWCSHCERTRPWRWQGSQDAWPAMWGTCWTFSDSSDERFARDNAGALAAIGFHVFETDELGVFIAIDGAGYDFYEAHWTPLYRLRGLHWHEESDAA
jgi:hypothetical protein